MFCITTDKVEEAANYFPELKKLKGHSGKLQEPVSVYSTPQGFVVLPRVGGKEVFLVTKNADFTEGRGQMFPDKLFYFLSEAVTYIMSKEGIYGSMQYLGNSEGVDINNKVYIYTRFNGYAIVPMELN